LAQLVIKKPNRSLRLLTRNRTPLSSPFSTCNPPSPHLHNPICAYPLELSLPSASIPSHRPLSDLKYSVQFIVTMSRPAPTNGHLVEHRRDTRIILNIEIRSRSMGINLPWDCIRIPQTKSVKRSVLGNKKALDFRLEVNGATTGALRDSLCRICTLREPGNSLIPRTVVDFTSRTDVINLKNGKAEVAFRFLCLSTHHGSADSEYR